VDASFVLDERRAAGMVVAGMKLAAKRIVAPPVPSDFDIRSKPPSFP
jgi:hypothetical protein